ncbi:tRNA-uridine aminocarboxypropyltransferase [Diaphorobacter sp. HDW4B]|uniref:tRNA-uridine aminocarboxypropyltransferase n=1 Tax=Diaphorobacter sp. HDW4B TaxID=2714925 RepID=UPI001F0E2D70|nr:tRNA-uridine aminocarboxypropyltransferase [Diaphorobacter sp. HDW4B]
MRTVRSPIEVLILMHPDEVGHAKNTGQLLHLCLPNSRVLIGTLFDDDTLQKALFGAWENQPKPPRTLLLYPGNDSLQAAPNPSPSAIRLVLIDSTWRKSRQMVTAHPLLQNLPRLSLQDPPASRYAIRKAHEPHQLSTLEAAQLALQTLDPDNSDQLNGLGRAMDAFVAFQRKFWPQAN